MVNIQYNLGCRDAWAAVAGVYHLLNIHILSAALSAVLLEGVLAGCRLSPLTADAGLTF